MTVEAPTRESLDAVHAANGDPSPMTPGSYPGATAQATTDGTWEVVVGGKQPDSLKLRLMGGAIEIDPPEGGWKKGRVYKLEVLARNIGPDIKDQIDSTTQQPVGTSKTDRLRVQDARFVEDVTEELRLAAEGLSEGQTSIPEGES